LLTCRGYLGQLGVRGAIEGGDGIHVSLLPCQEAQGPSHAESHATNLHSNIEHQRRKKKDLRFSAIIKGAPFFEIIWEPPKAAAQG